jgi:hypothetical protein
MYLPGGRDSIAAHLQNRFGSSRLRVVLGASSRNERASHMTARHQKSPGVWLAADHADLRSLARQHRHFQASQFTKLHFARAIVPNSIPFKPSHHNLPTGP